MKKRILSLDGGGIKGVFAAQLLTGIEKETGKRICDYFDLIAGTSTGGIIAAGLGLGIPAENILNLYLEKAKVLFPRTFLGWTKKVCGGQYDSQRLKKELEAVFGDRRIGDSKTRLVIPSYSISDRKAVVFKTAHHEDLLRDYKKPVVDVLMATTAAPTYFKPHKMDARTFIDGGIGANNPTSIALVEGLTKCGWDIGEIYVLSIGCTRDFGGAAIGKESMGFLDVTKLINSFMSAESQYSDNITRLLMNDRHYLRINPLIPERQTALDKSDQSALELLKSQGQQELQANIGRVKREYLDFEKEAFIPCYSN